MELSKSLKTGPSIPVSCILTNEIDQKSIVISKSTKNGNNNLIKRKYDE